jgi:dienelactone hydrolase
MTHPYDWLTPICDRSIGQTNKIDDMLAVAIDILGRIQQEYPIDKRRITVVGICAGGGAGWELVRREPRRFAAVIPLGAGAAPNREFAGPLTTPVWSFHAIGDKRASFKGAEESILAYKAQGGLAELTRINDTSHDCWYPAFQEHDLLHWILAQRRDDPNSPSPGHYRVKAQVLMWWSKFKLHFFVTTLLFALAFLMRRHLKTYRTRSVERHSCNNISLHSLNEDATTDNCNDIPEMYGPLNDEMKVPDFILCGEDVP